MATPVGNAIQAYNLASQQNLGTRPRGGEPTTSFAALVKSGYQAAKDASLHAERQSIQAITGDADLTELVQAVSQAELNLQALVSVRDKVIQAYQEVIRMPL